MHTCTNCGTPFDGHACPRCGVMAPQNAYGTQQPYNQSQQPAYYQPPPPQQYQAPPPQYQSPQPQYTPPPQYGQYLQPAYVPIPPAPPKSGHGKILLVIAVVIIIIIASVAAAFLFLVVTNPFNDAQVINDGDSLTGTLSGSGVDSLYKIELDPGEVLQATLTGDYGTDFDLYIYENVLFWDEFIITGSATDSSSETVTFVAWETDYYIIDVYSYLGSGDYTLDVDIIGTVSLDDGDNTISNAYPISSQDTISDTINEYYDEDDYYEIYVNSGEILYAFLEVPVQVNTDLDLYIYDASGNQLDVSEAAYGNEELSIFASTSGYYYVNVWAYDGMGLYSLYVEVTTLPAEDTNNGITTAQSITSGTVITTTINEYDDTDDYYSIDVPLGYTITATMSGPNTADFDLYIWNNGPQIVAASEELGSYETVSFTTPTSNSNGRFYINPYAYSGYGTYTLTVIVSSALSLNANAGFDKTVGTSQSVSFDGSNSGGSVSSYSWNFGDGGSATGATATHSYSSTGTYTVTLTVSDGSSSDSDTVTVTVVDSGSMPNKYALVIGISDYQGNDNDLSYCDEDADSWTTYLESQGYTVR
ncbi:MAG: PKD domain-containing protein, partial [Candidatus Thermoplasmatota archaeon]|nr:PKD domain-containing protein [Candidatus Thermoplasmatota archaeon]